MENIQTDLHIYRRSGGIIIIKNTFARSSFVKYTQGTLVCLWLMPRRYSLSLATKSLHSLSSNQLDHCTYPNPFTIFNRTSHTRIKRKSLIDLSPYRVCKRYSESRNIVHQMFSLWINTFFTSNS